MAEKLKRFASPLLWKLVGVTATLFLISLVISLTFSIISFQDIAGEGFEKIKREIIIVGILVFLFAAAAAFTLIESILSPLHIIIEKTRKISQGKTRERIKVGSQDELQDLAEIFNKLTGQFQETIRREKEVSQMKSEFLTIAAHQLRTPLSAIKWAFDTILGGDTGEITLQQRELLMKAYRKNEALITLIRDILDVVRIEEGKFSHRPEETQLEPIIEKLLENALPQSKQKDLTLKFEKPKTPLPPLILDRENIALAIQNLLTNAVQYTPKNGGITVTLTQKGRYAELQIRDTGIGIPKKELPRIFTKFFRALNAVRLETEGNGLGLFIVKNIVEKHGGKIMVKSVEGMGTHVFVRLPVPAKFMKSSADRYQKFIQDI